MKPSFGVSDALGVRALEESKELAGIDYGPQEFGGLTLVNDLERPAFEKFVLLAHLKTWLRTQPEVGAAMMSGSGYLFAVLREGANAEALSDTRSSRTGPRTLDLRVSDAVAQRLLADLFLQRRERVFAIQLCDEAGADLSGTNRFAFISVGAIAEAFRIHRRTIFRTRLLRSGCPWGKKARCETFAAVKSMADAFGQAAAQAPQPMQAAASMARSAWGFGTGIEFASGADPARAATKPPGLNDAIERAAIDHQIFDQGKGRPGKVRP